MVMFGRGRKHRTCLFMYQERGKRERTELMYLRRFRSPWGKTLKLKEKADINGHISEVLLLSILIEFKLDLFCHAQSLCNSHGPFVYNSNYSNFNVKDSNCIDWKQVF